MKPLLVLKIAMVVFICGQGALGAVDNDLREQNHSSPVLNMPTVLIMDKDKREYARVVESKLENWDTIIGELKNDARNSASATRAGRLGLIVNSLDRDARQARAHLRELKLARAGEWEPLKAHIEGRLEEMRRNYDRIQAE